MEADAVDDCLPPGTPLLQGQYIVERFLNAGGFGVTYLAHDSLDRRVVIKECFPSSLCTRTPTEVRARSNSHANDFDTVVRLFGQEARRLSMLRHPNIVGVHQVFEDNGTAYMAMDFVQGRDLLDVIDHEPHRLTPDRIEALLRCLLDAVQHVHAAGILHRDISPDNVLLRSDDVPVLIDFGAARDTARRSSRLLSALHVVKDGYSPQEFYLAGSSQTPAADVYSLGATFHHLVTGEAPPHSHLRVAALASRKPDPYRPIVGRYPTFPLELLQSIDKALEVFPEERYQSAGEWIDAIDPEARVRTLRARAAADSEIEEKIFRLVAEVNPYVAEAQRAADRAAAERRAAEEEAARLAAEKRARLRAEARAEAEAAAQWSARRRPTAYAAAASGSAAAAAAVTREEDSLPDMPPSGRRLWRRLVPTTMRRPASHDWNEVEI